MAIFWLLLVKLLASGGVICEPAVPNRSHQEITHVGIREEPFHLGRLGNGRIYYTSLERLRQYFLDIRNSSLDKAMRQMDELLGSNRAEGKLQRLVPEEVPFPCNVSGGRSPERPSRVSQIRPGDIDIIGAFGDSSVAGNGLLSRHFMDVVSEFRGFSFMGGGLGSWRSALTLPNILKLYNPQLYGYAPTHGLVADRDRSVFNLAEPMLIMRDLPYQAHLLIKRLRTDRRVDMKQHWKLLNIQVGLNDMCFEMCIWDDVNEYVRQQRQHFYNAFRLLRASVPRLIVNWVLIPNLQDFKRILLRMPGFCNIRIICSCMTVNDRSHFLDAAEQLRRIQLELASLPEFRGEDFAIVTHDLYRNLSGVVMTPGGDLDMRFFSHDCMHFSQRLHAIMTVALWNSMQQPLDTRNTRLWRRPLQQLRCPDPEAPFLRISQPEAERQPLP